MLEQRHPAISMASTITVSTWTTGSFTYIHGLRLPKTHCQAIAFIAEASFSFSLIVIDTSLHVAFVERLLISKRLNRHTLVLFWSLDGGIDIVGEPRIVRANRVMLHGEGNIRSIFNRTFLISKHTRRKKQGCDQ